MATSTYNGFPGTYRATIGKLQDAAFREGRWPRPTECEACGQRSGPVLAHLEDYDQPWTYIPLCLTCHLVLHCRHFIEPAIWTEYKARVARGWTPPVMQYGSLTASYFKGDWSAKGGGSWREPAPGPTYLDLLPDGKQLAPPTIVYQRHTIPAFDPAADATAAIWDEAQAKE